MTPNSKGIAERANRYLETSFCPAAASLQHKTSMIHSSDGFRSPTVAGCGSSMAVPSTSSMPTEPRC